jgi:hypothetical protein
MFDVNEIDETELVLLPKIEGTSEIEARKILTKSLAEIGKLTPEAWEFEEASDKRATGKDSAYRVAGSIDPRRRRESEG